MKGCVRQKLGTDARSPRVPRAHPYLYLYQLRSDGIDEGAAVVDEDELISLNPG